MKANGAAEADMMKLVGWSSTKQLARYGTALAEQRAIAAGQAHQVVRIMKGR
jgi:hypothetical protein